MKVIVFRFCGGMKDGQAVRSDQPEGVQNEADMFWKLTWNGTIGRRFDVSAPASGTFHRYQVKSKCDIGDEVHVTCEHIG